MNQATEQQNFPKVESEFYKGDLIKATWVTEGSDIATENYDEAPVDGSVVWLAKFETAIFMEGYTPEQALFAGRETVDEYLSGEFVFKKAR